MLQIVVRCSHDAASTAQPHVCANRVAVMLACNVELRKREVAHELRKQRVEFARQVPMHAGLSAEEQRVHGHIAQRALDGSAPLRGSGAVRCHVVEVRASRLLPNLHRRERGRPRQSLCRPLQRRDAGNPRAAHQRRPCGRAHQTRRVRSIVPAHRVRRMIGASGQTTRPIITNGRARTKQEHQHKRAAPAQRSPLHSRRFPAPPLPPPPARRCSVPSLAEPLRWLLRRRRSRLMTSSRNTKLAAPPW